MGKANKVKGELADVTEMVGLIQTLKDIADNKYYTLTSKKEMFRRFGETFVEFFRLISLTGAEHPLIANKNPKVGIVVVTIEGGFLGEFNNKIIRFAIEEEAKYDDVTFIAVGDRSIDHLRPFTQDIKIFEKMEKTGIYETAVAVKDYLIEQVMSGQLGKIEICYSWPRDFDTQLPRCNKLLPCDDLLVKQAQFVDSFENVIEESNPSDVIGFLANLWITTRLYEILMDSLIASASAQSKFLEDSVDKMKKERKKTAMKYLKAKKSDIDRSLRETFSARMMVTK